MHLVPRSRTLVLLGCLLAGCGMQRDGFSGGRLQQRLHRPGWAIDLGRSHEARATRPSDHRSDQPLAIPALRASLTMADHDMRSPKVQGAHRPAVVVPPMPHRSVVQKGPTAPIASPAIRPNALDRKDPVDKPRGVFNWLAPTALLVAIGVPLIGIALQNSALAIAGAAAGFILGLIASRQCRDKGRTGGGFAMAALILSSLLLVLTAIGFSQGGG